MIQGPQLSHHSNDAPFEGSSELARGRLDGGLRQLTLSFDWVFGQYCSTFCPEHSVGYACTTLGKTGVQVRELLHQVGVFKMLLYVLNNLCLVLDTVGVVHYIQFIIYPPQDTGI